MFLWWICHYQQALGSERSVVPLRDAVRRLVTLTVIVNIVYSDSLTKAAHLLYNISMLHIASQGRRFILFIGRQENWFHIYVRYGDDYG